MKKICSKCEIEKDIEDFYFLDKKKDKRCSICIKCKKEYNIKYRKTNAEILSLKKREKYKENIIEIRKYNNNISKLRKEKLKENGKKWRNENQEKIKKYNDEYVKNNKQKLKDYNKDYYKNNKQKLSDKNKEYAKENKEKIQKYKKEYAEKNKDYLNDKFNKYYHKYPYRHVWRIILKRTLSYLGTKKTDKTIKMLGYSALDLKIHIESLFTPQMSWENYGDWYIDHIKPVSSFDKDTPASVVNALSNLQPLWSTTREIDGILYEGNLNKGKS